MRLFLGLGLPDLHRDALASLQRKLPLGRAVPWGNFHLTLAFLGEGTTEMAEELDLKLGSMKITLPPILLKDLGQFGGAAPRAIWVGVEPMSGLDELNARLENAARRVGFTVPRRRFVPHVTLQRFARDAVEPTAIAAVLERMGGFALPSFQPWAVTLFQSHLRAEGPVYEALADYPITPDQTT